MTGRKRSLGTIWKLINRIILTGELEFCKWLFYFLFFPYSISGAIHLNRCIWKTSLIKACKNFFSHWISFVFFFGHCNALKQSFNLCIDSEEETNKIPWHQKSPIAPNPSCPSKHAWSNARKTSALQRPWRVLNIKQQLFLDHAAHDMLDLS